MPNEINIKHKIQLSRHIWTFVSHFSLALQYLIVNNHFCPSQSSMSSLAPDSMVRRVYQCMCSIDSGAASSGPGKTSSSAAASGVGREQLVIFLADTLRGTAEERAPLVMAMSQCGAGSTVVTSEQVAEVSERVRFLYQFQCFSFSFFCRNPATSMFPY